MISSAPNSPDLSDSDLPDDDYLIREMLKRHERERRRLDHVDNIATTMDAAFEIPGTQIPLGVDALVGLIPGIGDTISLGIAGYIMTHGPSLGARKRDMIRMGINVGIDWLIGLVPLIGDIFDIGWKGNLRNASLLRQAAERKWEKERLAAGIIDG